ncbi:unnamed protein product, partial [Effrenium voratum]
HRQVEGSLLERVAGRRSGARHCTRPPKWPAPGAAAAGALRQLQSAGDAAGGHLCRWHGDPIRVPPPDRCTHRAAHLGLRLR